MTPPTPVALGFVVYHPGAGFFERLRRLSEQGRTSYVFDNSPEDGRCAEFCRAHRHLMYLCAGRNVGLGESLADLAQRAQGDGHAQVLFFDQDTVFDERTLAHVGQFVATLPATDRSRLASVTFQGSPNGAAPATGQATFAVQDALLTINSGSLFFLDNLEKVGWHNRSFFVDGVDYEFCLRARRKGYRIGVCQGTPGFDHTEEQPDQFFTIMGKRLPLRIYAKSRVKDSVRAYLRLMAYTAGGADATGFVAITRSFAIFAVGQIAARLVLNKS
jgi:rhamnosyltransferase